MDHDSVGMRQQQASADSHVKIDFRTGHDAPDAVPQNVPPGPQPTQNPTFRPAALITADMAKQLTGRIKKTVTLLARPIGSGGRDFGSRHAVAISAFFH